MKLRIWVEIRSDKPGATQPDDMSLFLAVNKLDGDGNPVYFNGPFHDIQLDSYS